MVPMDGMQQCSRDPRNPKPLAYVKMPGGPRKQRRKEPGEAKMATKVTRVGTRGNYNNVINQVTIVEHVDQSLNQRRETSWRKEKRQVTFLFLLLYN